MTALLVDNQMDQNYLRKVHQTVQEHGHRALKEVVRASLEGLVIPQLCFVPAGQGPHRMQPSPSLQASGVWMLNKRNYRFKQYLT